MLNEYAFKNKIKKKNKFNSEDFILIENEEKSPSTKSSFSFFEFCLHK